MRSGTLRGVSKWSRRKDRYIGRLYSDIGKVPSDLGIFRSTEELREYGEEVLGLMGHEVEDRSQGARPPSPNRIGLGAGPPFLLLLLLLLSPSPPSFPPPSRSRTPTRRGKEVGREKERGAPPPLS